MDFCNLHRLSERELLEAIYRAVLTLNEESEHMSKELDDLTAEVAAETTIDQSAVALINGLAAQITAAGTDPAKLAALTTQMKTQSGDLAAAITANSPKPPTPTPTPAPVPPAA